MELRQLRYFVTVAEAGSLTAAAAKLYISQPAVTENIKNLETELGATLFYRSHKGMLLTNTGVTFLTYANSLLDLSTKAASVIKNAEENPVGTVTFMLPSSIGGMLSAELLGIVSALYPGIELRIIEFTTEFAEHIFSSNMCDFVVTFDTRNQKYLNIKSLAKEKLYLITRFDQKARHTQLEFSALGQYPLMTPNKHRGIRTILTVLAEKRNVKLQISDNSAPYSIILRLAEMGTTNIVSPYPPVDELVKSKRVSVFEIVKPKIFRQVNLVWPKDRPISNAADRIMALICQIIAKQHNTVPFR